MKFEVWVNPGQGRELARLSNKDYEHKASLG